jgi:hypothetical protein
MGRLHSDFISPFSAQSRAALYAYFDPSPPHHQIGDGRRVPIDATRSTSSRLASECDHAVDQWQLGPGLDPRNSSNILPYGDRDRLFV